MDAPSSSVIRQHDRCIICGETTFTDILTIPDPYDGHRIFTLQRCTQCQLVHTEPCLSITDLDRYYEPNYWHQPATEKTPSRGLVARFEAWFIESRISRTLRPALHYLQSGSRVLDVGCGDGQLLAVVGQAGYTPYGVELSPQAADYARTRANATVVCGTLESAEFETNYFHAITFFHVLEHLANPDKVLKEAWRILQPGGVVLIEIPNINSIGFKLFKRRWQPLEIPIHLYHFSPPTLARLLEECGFEVSRIAHFSARTSCALWITSAFPSLEPRQLRRRQREKRHVLIFKVLYFVLQIAALPLVAIDTVFKRGHTFSIVARKPNSASSAETR